MRLTSDILPVIITGIVCALVVLQPDLGTSALIAIVAFSLFFIAGADLKQFATVLARLCTFAEAPSIWYFSIHLF